MTNPTLARSYLSKAQKRLKVLPVLHAEEAWSDVVREAQEIVELAQKGMLRQVGLEPPRWHDVGQVLLAHASRFAEEVVADLERLAAVSAWLRKEREFSFYGDIDFIPTEQYSEDDALHAEEDASWVVSIAAKVITLE